MITKRERKLSAIMIVAQVGLTIVLFFLLDGIFPHKVFGVRQTIFILTQIILIWSILLSKFNLGIIFREATLFDMIRGYVATAFLGCGFLLLEFELLPLIYYHIEFSLKFIALFAVVDLIVLIAFKVVFYYTMRYLRRAGHNSRHIIIVADINATSFIDSFIHAKDWGYSISGIVSPDKSLLGKYEKTYIVKNHANLKRVITQYTIDDIFYCLPIDDNRYNLEQLIQDAEEIGVSLHIMQPDNLNGLIDEPVKKRKGHDRSFVTYSAVPHNYISLKVKEGFDIIFSALALIVISPVMFLIAVLIKMEDGGPILFKQERISLNGRRFMCYKFRSMIINAEDHIDKLQEMNESDGPTFKIENDPRITKIGRFIRKTSLDELPQFYNVIKGDMSVVGPRPPLLKEVMQYERSQLRRLSMKPGITCIWQVWGRNQVSFKEWMRMDLEYIDSWSLWLDFRIMLATIGVILKAKGR